MALRNPSFGLEKKQRWRSEVRRGYLAFEPGGGPAPWRSSASAGPCEEERFPWLVGAFIFISGKKTKFWTQDLASFESELSRLQAEEVIQAQFGVEI